MLCLPFGERASLRLRQVHTEVPEVKRGSGDLWEARLGTVWFGMSHTHAMLTSAHGLCVASSQRTARALNSSLWSYVTGQRN